jgi:hypothetical protein
VTGSLVLGRVRVSNEVKLARRTNRNARTKRSQWNLGKSPKEPNQPHGGDGAESVDAKSRGDDDKIR